MNGEQHGALMLWFGTGDIEKIGNNACRYWRPINLNTKLINGLGANQSADCGPSRRARPAARHADTWR